MRKARPLNLRAPLLGAAEVAALLGWDPRRVAVYARRGALPKPLAWLASGPVWARGTIETYMGKRQAVPEPTPEPKPAPKHEPVRFVSPHAGLVIVSGPHGTIRFRGGVYETSDEAEIGFLRAYAARSPEVREESVTPS